MVTFSNGERSSNIKDRMNNGHSAALTPGRQGFSSRFNSAERFRVSLSGYFSSFVKVRKTFWPSVKNPG